jgi:hypothetical protein
VCGQFRRRQDDTPRKTRVGINVEFDNKHRKIWIEKSLTLGQKMQVLGWIDFINNHWYNMTLVNKTDLSFSDIGPLIDIPVKELMITFGSNWLIKMKQLGGGNFSLNPRYSLTIDKIMQGMDDDFIEKTDYSELLDYVAGIIGERGNYTSWEELDEWMIRDCFTWKGRKKYQQLIKDNFYKIIYFFSYLDDWTLEPAILKQSKAITKFMNKNEDCKRLLGILENKDIIWRRADEDLPWKTDPKMDRIPNTAHLERGPGTIDIKVFEKIVKYMGIMWKPNKVEPLNSTCRDPNEEETKFNLTEY